MASLAIIGTAGRGADARRLTPRHFADMVEVARLIVDDVGPVELVSGGAAWADHVAVVLFLQELKITKTPRFRLTLHLPAEFDLRDRRFVEKPDAGGIANQYHDAFLKVRDGYRDLAAVHSSTFATVKVYNGFFARNSEVAKSDHLLASSFGVGTAVIGRGTTDTLGKWLKRPERGRGWALDLNTGLFHEGPIIGAV